MSVRIGQDKKNGAIHPNTSGLYFYLHRKDLSYWHAKGPPWCGFTRCDKNQRTYDFMPPKYLDITPTLNADVLSSTSEICMPNLDNWSRSVSYGKSILFTDLSLIDNGHARWVVFKFLVDFINSVECALPYLRIWFLKLSEMPAKTRVSHLPT